MQKWPPPLPSGGGGSATRGVGRPEQLPWPPPNPGLRMGSQAGSAHPRSPTSRPRRRSARPTPRGETPGARHPCAGKLESLGRGRDPAGRAPAPLHCAQRAVRDPKTPLFV